MKLVANELDVFMLTMDEPNCEKHWSMLLEICPWASRIAGVQGFDAAHRAAAEAANSEWFIVIDADNIVDEAFFDQEFVIDHPCHCVSFNARNALNGLQYGNGGVRIWQKNFVMNMRTHEN